MADDDRRRRWYPTDADYRLIWEHLQAQADLDPALVRLDDGRTVKVGLDAVGEL